MESEINCIELMIPVRAIRQSQYQYQTVRRYLRVCGLTDSECSSVLQLASIFPPGGVQVIKNMYSRNRPEYHVRMI